MPANAPSRRFSLARLLFLMLAGLLPAGGRADTNQIYYRYAEKVFSLSQSNLQANPKAAAAAGRLARASFEFADLATNDTQRAEISQIGITTARQLVTREPKAALGHYLLAMNLGELAQAEAPSLAAYKLVHEVEHEFKQAAELDDTIDYGGPARTLGLLYYQAPGWPLSVGNKHKARQWLERAVAVAPEYPDNQLNLAEAYLKWRLKDETAKVLVKTEAIWPVAKTNLTGEAHARDWRDWEARRQGLRAEFQRIYKTVP